MSHDLDPLEPADPGDGLSDETPNVSLPDALDIHRRWQRRLAALDPYALEVADACERWELEQSAHRELRRWRREYKEALSRRDTATASRLWANICDAKETLRATRRPLEV